MKSTITSPVANETSSSLTAMLADRRRRSRTLAEAMQKLSDLYWEAHDEQAQIDAEAAAIEQYIEDLEAMVHYRTGDPDRCEGHKTRRMKKREDRRAAAAHRENGLASGLSDATHVKLTGKAKRKAKRNREADKTTTRIRKAQLRKQAERGLNPAEVLPLPVKRSDREAYFAELAEARRISIIAACTCPHLVAANLNGECHDHYTV